MEQYRYKLLNHNSSQPYIWLLRFDITGQIGFLQREHRTLVDSRTTIPHPCAMITYLVVAFFRNASGKNSMQMWSNEGSLRNHGLCNV